MTRTCDTRIRNPVLYPLSYGGNIFASLDREAFVIISSHKRQDRIHDKPEGCPILV